jgi:hypothetical protein
MAGRGGKRENAGRKRVRPEESPAPNKSMAGRILARPYKRSDGKVVDEDAAWDEFLYGGDLDRALRARMYLTDKRDGKPAQSVIAGGRIEIEVIEIAASD